MNLSAGLLYPYCGKYRIDAMRPAQDAADETWLPQTVFYHSDWGWTHTSSGARILSDKQTKVAVTWLPARYFDNGPSNYR